MRSCSTLLLVLPFCRSPKAFNCLGLSSVLPRLCPQNDKYDSLYSDQSQIILIILCYKYANHLNELWYFPECFLIAIRRLSIFLSGTFIKNFSFISRQIPLNIQYLESTLPTWFISFHKLTFINLMKILVIQIIKPVSFGNIWAIKITQKNQKKKLQFTYICHRQSSSSIFPNAALIPPCAATVWDLVGNSLVITAVLNPSCTRPKAARRPAPPAPTTTASYSWSITEYAFVP